eukprot:1158229-Pelagomonas_calceolata.AAC.3
MSLQHKRRCFLLDVFKYNSRAHSAEFCSRSHTGEHTCASQINKKAWSCTTLWLPLPLCDGISAVFGSRRRKTMGTPGAFASSMPDDGGMRNLQLRENHQRVAYECMGLANPSQQLNMANMKWLRGTGCLEQLSCLCLPTPI